jgi:hypothetical protein
MPTRLEGSTRARDRGRRNAVTLATLDAARLREIAPSRQAAACLQSRPTLFALQRGDFLVALTSHPRSDDRARELAAARLLEQDAADSEAPAG